MTSAHRPSDAIDIRHGDALDVLRSLADESVDAIGTDPPYGLSEEPDMAEVLTHWLAGDDYVHRGGGFMGKAWDSFVPGPAVWREAYRALKPGGHLLCFAGTRTSDLMGISIRLAGFEIRDRIRVETTGAELPAELAWTYGSGFPKSLDVGKSIDKAAGAEREVIGRATGRAATPRNDLRGGAYGSAPVGLIDTGTITSPATEDAARWDGWGTGLKPAYEPIIVARKPLAGTVAANVLTHGTGALNIDGCRVAGVVPSVPQPDFTKVNGQVTHLDAHARNGEMSAAPGGRWPSNVVLVHAEGCVPVGTRKVRTGIAVQRNGGGQAIFGGIGDGENGVGEREDAGYAAVEAWECVEGCPVAEMDAQSGPVGGALRGDDGLTPARTAMAGGRMAGQAGGYGDQGGASRFFPTFKYQAKADGSERPSYIGPVCFSDSDCTQITDEMHPSGWPDWARDPKGVCPECDTPCGPIMHPTVKPVDLMRWLVRLVVPKVKPGDDRPPPVVVDMFAGTGATAEAVLLEGGLEGLVRCIVGDKVGAHIPLIEQRVEKYDDPRTLARARRGEKVPNRVKATKARPDTDGHDLFADWAS